MPGEVWYIELLTSGSLNWRCQGGVVDSIIAVRALSTGGGHLNGKRLCMLSPWGP